MAQVQGTVISISVETDVKKQGGGSYKGWELVYKTPDGEVRTIAKPVQGLRFNAALKNQLSDLVAGDTFTLVQEKNAQGFNDVKSVTKGFSDVEQAPAPTAQGAKPTTSGGSNSYTQRDFESKDERTVKQRLIVRQSSVAQAVAILSVGSKSVNIEDVKSLAEDLTDFVYEQKRGQAGLDAIDDDIPN